MGAYFGARTEQSPQWGCLEPRALVPTDCLTWDESVGWSRAGHLAPGERVLVLMFPFLHTPLSLIKQETQYEAEQGGHMVLFPLSWRTLEKHLQIKTWLLSNNLFFRSIGQSTEPWMWTELWPLKCLFLQPFFLNWFFNYLSWWQMLWSTCAPHAMHVSVPNHFLSGGVVV